MKRVIKASYSPTQRVHEILDILSEYGVGEHELLMQCIDWFPSDDLVECFSDYARLADIPLDEEEYIGESTKIQGAVEVNTYVVKIYHEVEANGEDTYGPEAAEEIYTVAANGPEEAYQKALKVWNGPVDNVEIIAVDPNEDYDDPDIPFDFDEENASYYKEKHDNPWAYSMEDYYTRDAERAYGRR